MQRFYTWRYAAAVVFIGMCIVIGLVISRQGSVSEQNVHKLCVKTNDVVVESNARIPSLEYDTKGLIDFLTSAEEARRAAYKRTGAKEDLRAAESYADIIQYVKANVHYDSLSELDCKALFK